MNRNREYKAIKNFVHNELGLSKEECKDLFIQAIKDEGKEYAKKLIQAHNHQHIIYEAIGGELKNIMSGSSYSWNQSKLMEIAGKYIAQSLEIKTK